MLIDVVAQTYLQVPTGFQPVGQFVQLVGQILPTSSKHW